MDYSINDPWWSFEKRKHAHTSDTNINSTEIEDVSIKKEMIKLPLENERNTYLFNSEVRKPF